MIRLFKMLINKYRNVRGKFCKYPKKQTPPESLKNKSDNNSQRSVFAAFAKFCLHPSSLSDTVTSDFGVVMRVYKQHMIR